MTDQTASAPRASHLPGDVTADDANTKARRGSRINGSAVVMTLYILFLMLPIYWLLNMSLKTNAEILGSFSLFPQRTADPAEKAAPGIRAHDDLRDP